MKTIQRMLLVLAILTISILGAQAQYLANMPSAGFGSTSSNVYTTGSSYQSSAVTGYVSADDYYNSNISGRRSNSRRIGGGDDEEEWNPGGDEHLPDVNMPIGDGLYILLLLAGIVAWRISRRRKIGGIAAIGE